MTHGAVTVHRTRLDRLPRNALPHAQRVRWMRAHLLGWWQDHRLRAAAEAVRVGQPDFLPAYDSDYFNVPEPFR